MKKIIFVLTLLLLVSPVLAVDDVVISCTANNETGVVSVYWAGSDAKMPRAFALDVKLNNATKIMSASNFNSDFWVHPGSIIINDANGNIDSYGSAVASATEYPGVTEPGPPDNNSMTIEMGSLYAPVTPGSPNRPDVNDTLLFTFVVDNDCTVAISGNTARGNVVLEDENEAVVGYGSGCTVALVCGTCPGDLDNNDYVTTGDLSALLYKIVNASGNWYECGLGDMCDDMGTDGYATTADLSALLYNVVNASGNWYACP